MRSPNFQSLRNDVEELFRRISRNVREGGSKERLVDDVNECLEKLRRIGEQHRNECALSWLADQGIALASVEGISPSLREDVAEQIFAWLDTVGKGAFGRLRDEAMIYSWCARENLGIRNSIYRDYRTAGSPEPESIFSNEELDAFYAEEPRGIWNALVNRVFPQGGVYLEDPLATPGALDYYKTYKRALTIPRVEKVISKDEARLS